MTMEKPSKNEDEYFTRLELERKKQWEKERLATVAESEKQRLRELHYMKCPKCGNDLHTIPIEGVSADHCLSCGGTFLDQGELDELIRHQEHKGVLHRAFSLFRSGGGE